MPRRAAARLISLRHGRGMKSIESELEELRARVARLEADLARLNGEPPGVTHTSAPPAALPVSAPPVIAAAAPAAAATPSAAPRAEPPPLAAVHYAPPKARSRLEEVPSTVWIAAAGAVIFLLGAIYALTVSIERGWISPPVRVTAGLVFSLGAGVWAARLLFGASRTLGVTLLAVAAGTWTFSLYFGSKEAHLFAPALGFGGAAVATLLAGAIAARVRSDGAMAVALATGLAAPLAFSTGSGTVAGLSAYLAGLLVAQLAAHYVSGTGATWAISRALALGALWVVALSGAVGARLGEPLFAAAALAGLLPLSLLVAWLPRHPEAPVAPAAGSVAGFAAAALGLWIIWDRGTWWNEAFAAVLVVLAAGALLLVVGARRRTGTRRHDFPLMLLAAGFGLLAVPVALDWKWLSIAWGLAAALSAWAAVRATDQAGAEARALRVVARVAASLATLAWVIGWMRQPSTDWIFVNRVFAGGVLAAVAWAWLMKLPGPARGVMFILTQLVAVNALACELFRAVPSIHEPGAFLPLGALLATLVYAVAGAAQWLRGVLYETDELRAKALRFAGYGWLVAAAAKLLVHDLGETDLVFRAIAALCVGAVFIGAALWADRHRVKAQRNSS